MKALKTMKYIVIGLILLILMACNSETTESEATEEAKETEGVHGGEIKIAYPAQPPGMDPHIASAIATTDLMSHVYETLITVDEDYNIEPMLADSWEQSDDGKTITFYLREGVLFHNGEEMTAEDVVASMERWKHGVGARGQFDEATFEAIDAYTVELSMPEPLSTALITLSYMGSGFAAIMPKDVVENASETSVEEYIGTGPYEYVEWRQDQYLHLTKFEDYQSRPEDPSGFAGRKEAFVDDIHFIFTPDTSTMVAGIQSGEYDIIFGTPYDDVELLESNRDLYNITFPNAYMVIVFNKQKGLFADVKAREAVLAGLDMEEGLIAAFTSDEYYTLNHNMMMYHQSEQWDSDVGEDRYHNYDPELAEQLLAEAGYDGEEITFMTTRDYEEHYNVAVVVQEQLEKIGMDINLEVYDWPTLLDRWEDEDAFDFHIYGAVPVPEPTALSSLNPTQTGWTDSDEIVKLVKEFRSQPTVEEAQALYGDLQAAYWDYIPVIKVGDYDKIATLQNSVKNYEEQNRNHRLMLWNVSNDK